MKNNEIELDDLQDIPFTELPPIVGFETINTHSLLSSSTYHFPPTYLTPFVVDDSYFCPMSEAVKQLNSNSVGVNIDNLRYDFVDGKDTGFNPYNRSGHKDLAEISQDVLDRQIEVSDKISKFKQDQEYNDKLRKELNAASSSKEPSDSSVS